MTALERVYAAIVDYWRENAIPPAIRDVIKATGVRSTSDVSRKYRQLAVQGWIVLVKGHPVPVEILRLIQSFVSKGV